MNLNNKRKLSSLLNDANETMETTLQKKRSMQTHDLNKSRSINGEYSILFPMLKDYPNKFVEYMRMKVTTFECILSKINLLLMKKWCNLHIQPILPEERLVLTLRFLATGASYSHLAFSFKMGIKTVSSIIKETLNVLWVTLAPIHMPIPSCLEFIKISEDFDTKWGFPHCLGAIDGRHVAISKPSNSGSLYYNYKGYFSIVLQAVVDAHYRYIFIDVGGFGYQHDSATFHASQFYKALMEKKISIPKASQVKNTNLYLPYFFIGDGAYPLTTFLIKPYIGTNLLNKQRRFNKRLSRARAVVENAFAYTSQKWRILYSTIDKTPEIVNLIIKCTCVLHNAIIDLEPRMYIQIPDEEQRRNLNDDSDVLVVPLTSEDMRTELATLF